VEKTGSVLERDVEEAGLKQARRVTGGLTKLHTAEFQFIFSTNIAVMK